MKNSYVMTIIALIMIVFIILFIAFCVKRRRGADNGGDTESQIATLTIGKLEPLSSTDRMHSSAPSPGEHEIFDVVHDD